MAYLPGDGPDTGGPYVGDPVPEPHSHPATHSAPSPTNISGMGYTAPAPDYSHSQPSGYLTIGSRGPAVADLQRKLGITADGIYGPATAAAVRAYQQRHGLAQDGVAGPATLGSLGLATNPHSGNGPVGSTSSGSGSRTAASTSSTGGGGASTDTTPAERAAEYGWSLAVINSVPELKTIFAQASAPASKGGNWSTARFIAAVRDTNWFKTHTDTWRQAYIQQKADPATWNNNLTQAMADVTSLAQQFGANIPLSTLRQMATDKLMFGWDNQQLAQHISLSITANSSGTYSGGAGAAQSRYNAILADYGVGVSPQTMGQWVRASVLNAMTDDNVKQYAIQQAASRYPALAERLKAGESLRSIADPYLQDYQRILEVDSNNLSLNDPLIQQALQAKDAKGLPAVQTLYQFDQALRNDPRWSKTQNAKDAAANIGHGVLQSFGLVS